MDITKIIFGLRTCQSNHMEKKIIWFDKGFRRAVKDSVVGGRSFFEDFQWMMTSLAIRVGG